MTHAEIKNMQQPVLKGTYLKEATRAKSASDRVGWNVKKNGFSVVHMCLVPSPKALGESSNEKKKYFGGEVR